MKPMKPSDHSAPWCPYCESWHVPARTKVMHRNLKCSAPWPPLPVWCRHITWQRQVPFSNSLWVFKSHWVVERTWRVCPICNAGRP